jgi:DNA primase
MTKPYLKHVPAGVYRDMLEQRLAELSKTNLATLNRHLEKPAQPTRKPVKKPTMATMTPIRMAITILLQYPILAREIEDIAVIRQSQQPGVNILADLVETLHQHPHLTTAALLERWRDKENGAHLQKLALQPLSLSADALKHELTGIVVRLNNEARAQRIHELTSKPFSELTEAEKAEVKSYK